MKQVLIVIILFPLLCFAQTDTLIVKPKQCSTSGTGKDKKYFVDNKIVDSLTYATARHFYDSTMYKIGEFTTKWVKYYDKSGHMIYQGLMYSDSPVGEFITYYSNGKIRARGFYTGLPTTEEEKKKQKKWKSTKIGDWYEYNVNGQLIKTEHYDEKGQLIKTVK
ncbi:MAG TPA: hypothetical protein VKG26_05805 [Bacteroidia bacterium]|nr:hypothetical protein [Bacteroidia bacterium]